MKKLNLLIFLLVGIFVISCGPIEEQKYIPLDEGDGTERSKHRRYSLVDKSQNHFNKKEGFIYLKVPITEPKLKAKYCENVSSESLAAIVVVLDGNNGDPTNEQPVKGFQQMKVNIKKLKLDNSILKDSLRVYILHDNRYKKDKLKKIYEKCVDDAEYYSETDCNLYQLILEQENFAPREQGGDIIPPTGG
ncbi:hypothetical protein [Winogradskyella poriferorum]|uniref:hypothetical protein n=1 Tax=Winogradskyella poriferorum TaxID=307627 RepID=UPI003D64B482